MNKKIYKISFICLFLATLLIPLVCMSFAKTDHLSGSTGLAEFPSATQQDGTYNKNFFNELGKYFENHFAFRPQLVTANAILRNNIFKDSGTKQVIVGNNGFYFYVETMNDYLGKNDLSERDLKSIANNLSIMQNYIESNGSNFVFTISPNKNTLYPSCMPYYFMATQKQHNAIRLKPYLEQYGIHYIDMFEEFSKDNNINYLKEDSHWSNKGALKTTNSILQCLNKTKIEPENWENRNDRDGDIYAMMYPSIIGKESEDYAIGYNDKDNLTGDNWSFDYGNSVEDSLIQTKSSGNKSLYMYRDSFANSLIPYLSSSYNNATYTKLIPYDLVAPIKNNCDDVVIERTERHLSYLCEKAPLMPSPICKINSPVAYQNKIDCSIEYSEENDYLNIYGNIDEEIFNTSDNIYVQIEGKNYNKAFKAFWLKDNSYFIRVYSDEIPVSANIKLLLEQNSCVYTINEYNLNGD